MTATRLPTKILLIYADAPDERQVEYLRKAGLEVDAADADAAIERAIEFEPDVIVLDFAANGDLLYELKHGEATKHTPVIALVELFADR